MISASPQRGDNPRPPFDSSRRSGVALVLVLAFIVLLTGLIVAYFTRSMTSRQLSNSSAGQTKSAMLAQSASDIVISGLKQEIVNGSSTVVVGTSPNQSNLYVPAIPTSSPSGTYAVPVRYGTPAPNATSSDPIPNLVRRSVAGDSAGNSGIPSPAVPSLASKVNSQSDPSLNGRTVTLARWNSHYLIPSQSTDTVANSVPDTSVGFTAPDWVLMTRNGPAVETAVGSDTQAINNPSSTNLNYVIGRYAYAIYDEGGLLDMNVAGHPSVATPASPTGFTATQVGKKGSLALADLTQLPLIKNPGSSDYLAQSVIDDIVGWRNYASSKQATPTFPTFTFNASNASSWYSNFASSNTTGFLQVYNGTAAATGPTDQAFLSRQQLLQLRNSINGGLPSGNATTFGANALQYMGTFSRTLDQPSFIPANLQYPGIAPSINQVSATAPPNADLADSYAGNNDAAGTAPTGGAAQDLINPSFLTVRVTHSFTRFDGSTAVVGEPLVKKRASLKHLAWLTYKGPSASVMSDPVVQQGITAMGGNPSDPNDPVYKFVALGDATHIADYFGLSWDSTDNRWNYNHGSDKIRTLSDVAGDTSRKEPDFIELLKAAINVGSLAKGGPNLNQNSSYFNYQYTLDTAVDYNVLQIMADLVDQFDTDSYPTVIGLKVTPSTGSSYYRQFRGIEDIPYFYRYQPFTVVTALPSPLLSQTSGVTFPITTPGYKYSGNATTPPTTFTFTRLSQAPLSNPGQMAFLYVPEIWNPHDANTLATSASNRPSSFRILAETTDPIGATSPNWQIGVQNDLTNYYTDWQGVVPASLYPKSLTPAPLTPDNTAMQFSDANGSLFREPTLLWRKDYPAGINLSGVTTVTDINSTKSYLGILAGTAPISESVSINSQTYTAQAQSSEPTAANPAANLVSQITFQMQYMSPSGQWVTYDEKYPDLHGIAGPTLVVDKDDFPNSQWANPFSSGAFGSCATSYDPRAARFGIGTGDNLGHVLTGSSPSVSPEVDTTNNSAVGSSNFTAVETQRPTASLGDPVNYSNPGMTSNPGKNHKMRWESGVGYSASGGSDDQDSPNFYDGLLTQNNWNITLSPKAGSTTAHLYYEDADGVDRRAMAAYVPTGGINTPATAPFGLPLITGTGYNSAGTSKTNVYSQARPFILNRPFRSVAEMGYTWRGGPWKNIDFFTPESGDTGLLDVFCVDEAPTNGIVAGKVNMNTHQAPVIKAILAGAYQDEAVNAGGTPSQATTGLSLNEADEISKLLVSTTQDVSMWRGPLANIGELVGRYVGQNVSAGSATDLFSFTEPETNTKYTYAGFSARLSDPSLTWASAHTPTVQRFREAAVRSLASTGQTRVWNLMIDMVAQTGKYPPTATDLTKFLVEGEQRIWVHVAIDRYTGEIIDKQVETVTE